MKLSRCLGVCIVLISILASCSSPQGFRANIIGEWDSPKFSNTYEFFKNGTGTISTTKDRRTSSFDFSYEFIGEDEIVINYENGSKLTFEVSMPDNDTLILTSTSPGQTRELHRKK